ncbi:hypothetical protein K469DRAFT_687519 [Zopfia rhizophila CBS 207.26]|uniref:Uncharacterized protein n=1 Tax=Zopfia rhizophila CBS 207.26 TaxID=1314779 RepID=A0A6A6E6M6_9PEZI|nr:hypothetical protein K469DRAFT_687519 [Zopfia rhizophila CBS 207.26]
MIPAKMITPSGWITALIASCSQAVPVLSRPVAEPLLDSKLGGRQQLTSSTAVSTVTHTSETVRVTQWFPDPSDRPRRSLLPIGQLPTIIPTTSNPKPSVHPLDNTGSSSATFSALPATTSNPKSSVPQPNHVSKRTTKTVWESACVTVTETSWVIVTKTGRPKSPSATGSTPSKA